MSACTHCRAVRMELRFPLIIDFELEHEIYIWNGLCIHLNQNKLFLSCVHAKCKSYEYWICYYTTHKSFNSPPIASICSLPVTKRVPSRHNDIHYACSPQTKSLNAHCVQFPLSIAFLVSHYGAAVVGGRFLFDRNKRKQLSSNCMHAPCALRFSRGFSCSFEC